MLIAKMIALVKQVRLCDEIEQEKKSYTVEPHYIGHFCSQENRPDKRSVRIIESDMIDLCIFWSPKQSSGWGSIWINGVLIDEAPL
jgi:hypothetical protein